MLAGLRLGPGPRVRKFRWDAFPELTVIQEHLFELSRTPAGARFDFSWSLGSISYILTVSQPVSIADWKLYRCTGHQSTLLWEHRTNDVTLIYNLVVSETGEGARAISGDGRLSTVHGKMVTPEANTGAFVTCPRTPSSSSPQPILGSFDLAHARQLTERLCTKDLEIYSYPSFLLMFDQEYCRAVDHGSRFTIVLFKIESLQKQDMTDTEQSDVYECLKQMKRLHRKTDILAKYTADRFVALLPETDAKGGKLFAQKIERALFRNALLSGTGGFVKITFGIATLQNRWTAGESMLLAAEHALSKAEMNEETVVVFDPASDPPTETKRIELDRSIQSLMQIANVQGGVYSHPAFVLMLEREYHRANRHQEDLFVLQFRLKANQTLSDDRAETACSVAHAQFLERLLAFKQDGDVLAFNPDQTMNVMRRGASAGCLKNLASSLARRLGTDRSLTIDYGLGKFQILSRICKVAKDQSSSECLNLIGVV
jgi:GGDEF domain-containing protein